MKSYRIHLLRHGLTEGNKLGQYIGQRSDFPLCEEGKQELQSLQKHYDYPDIEKLYCSPLLRCTETADILYEGYTPCIVEDLAEFDFGEFEGLSAGDMDNPDKFSRWLSGETSEDIDAENPKEFAQRVVAAFEQIVEDMMQNEILSGAVITHGGVIMTLLAALGLPKRPITDWIINNGMGYTVLVTATVWMRDHVFELYEIIPRASDVEDDEQYCRIQEEDDDISQYLYEDYDKTDET